MKRTHPGWFLLCLIVATFGVRAFAQTEPPVLLVLIVDKSGSIAENKLVEPVNAAVAELVAGLDSNTQVRIIFFDTTATQPKDWLPPVDKRKKNEILNFFKDGFRPGNQTRLFDTVGEAIQQVLAEQARFRGVDVKILSDGDDNRSTRYRSWAALDPITDSFTAGKKGVITWYTLGFKSSSKAAKGVDVTAVPDPQKDRIHWAPPLARPVAAFDASPRTVRKGDVVKFRVLVPTGIEKAQWNVGEGAPLEGLLVSHAYQQAGTFPVKLKVVGPSGEDELEVPSFVQVVEIIPVKAAFTVSPRSAKVGEEILFALENTAGIESVVWNFGDGAVATSATTRHVYSSAGRYSVSLEVKGPGGGR